MKRFMQLTVVAASLALSVGVLAAQGGIRPDDRTNHGVGSIGLEEATGVVRPDDRATHGPGSTAPATTDVSIRPDDRATHGPGALPADTATRVIRPDDRATHGPGVFFAGTSTQAVRPDDRAWRGVGPAPTGAVSDTQSFGRDGFDWADAGIGALAATGLGLLFVGVSVLAVRRQRVASYS